MVHMWLLRVRNVDVHQPLLAFFKLALRILLNLPFAIIYCLKVRLVLVWWEFWLLKNASLGFVGENIWLLVRLFEYIGWLIVILLEQIYRFSGFGLFENISIIRRLVYSNILRFLTCKNIIRNHIARIGRSALFANTQICSLCQTIILGVRMLLLLRFICWQRLLLCLSKNAWRVVAK